MFHSCYHKKISDSPPLAWLSSTKKSSTLIGNIFHGDLEPSDLPSDLPPDSPLSLYAHSPGCINTNDLCYANSDSKVLPRALCCSLEEHLVLCDIFSLSPPFQYSYTSFCMTFYRTLCMLVNALTLWIVDSHLIWWNRWLSESPIEMFILGQLNNSILY